MKRIRTMGNYSSFLLVAVLLISGISHANPGVNIQGTYVLERDQYPASLKKYNAAEIYLIYSGKYFSKSKFEGLFLRGDTITNFRKFGDSLGRGIDGFRLLFQTKEGIDSAWQVSSEFRITDKAYNLGDGLLKIVAYDSLAKIADQFIFKYEEKFNENTRGRTDGIIRKDLAWLLRQYRVYDTYDRNNYAVGSVWALSIGIDDYGALKYEGCKTDARSYAEFFKKQYTGGKQGSVFASLFHEYVLMDKEATKEAILSALKDIARKATYNDYFIFTFSGCSNEIKDNKSVSGTHFFTYDVLLKSQNTDNAIIENRDKNDTTNPENNCISLRILQEYIQLIPASNQLFISEAGPSGKFKTEFIKTLMQGSPEISRILNKNRVIIVPNGFGKEGYFGKESIPRGAINFYLTSLDSVNIYDLFKEGYRANQVAFSIKYKVWQNNPSDYAYFDIFFEKKFLKDYQEIFQGTEGESRETICPGGGYR
jgi:Caspase domain